MKPVERKRFARVVQAAVPELADKGRLLAATPRKRILRGIYLEDSSTPVRLYAWAFVQPLYVPSPTVSFSLGVRLGGPSKAWAVTEVDELAALAANEGRSFFGPLSSPEALADWAFLVGRSDPYALEARAYSLVAAGRLAAGAKALRDLKVTLQGGTPWMLDMQRRAEQLCVLVESECDRVLELLRRWEQETARSLGVEDLP